MIIGDSKILGNGLKVSANLRFPMEDLSGSTSSTNTAENGIKPKSLSVSLNIPFKDSAHLKSLTLLAEGQDDNASMKIYDIVDRTAQAMNIRQVKFSDNFFVKEARTLKQWSVSFSLLEVRSVPEKVEQRQSSLVPVDQSVEGQTVGSSTFETTLTKINEVL